MPRKAFNAEGAVAVGRATIGVASLPLGAQVEIEMIGKRK